MTEKIRITRQMVIDAYKAGAGPLNRITDVTADYIAKGLTEQLNPKWEFRRSGHVASGVVKGESDYRLYVYGLHRGSIPPGGVQRRMQELADFLNEHDFQFKED